MRISGFESELLQRPLDFPSKARKVPGFIPHGVFFRIPKLINLFQGTATLGVALAGGPKARSFVPLGFERAAKLGHSRTGLSAISHGGRHPAGATERLDEAFDAPSAVALGPLNPWKPHLSYDLESTNGRERRNE